MPKTIARNLLIVLLCLGIAAAVAELLFSLHLGPQNAILLFVLAIFLVAVLTDGYAYCVSAAVVGVFVFDYLVTEPRMAFSFTVGFPVTLTIMLLVALVTSGVTARIKLRAKEAGEKERLSEQLYQINDRLLSAHGDAAIAHEANDFIARQMGHSSCVYQASGAVFPNGLDGDVPVDAFVQPGLTARVEAMCGDGDTICAVAEGPLILFPLTYGGQCTGALGVSTRRGPLSAVEERFLALLAGQAGQAFHVEELRRQRQRADIAAETEKARSWFLRAISHDLRTPLTSIIGASATLLDGEAELSPAVRRRLAGDIHGDAQWLLRLVQNVLFTTRLQAGGLDIAGRVEAMEEVVANAVMGVRKRFDGCQIEVVAPDRLILAPMDALLVAQVLTNLLENALRHGGEGARVEIILGERDGRACVTVADDGPGLPDEVLAAPFAYKPGRTDSTRGFGMGLMICKAIIDAHHGTIRGENRPGGGARFEITLPMEEVKP